MNSAEKQTVLHCLKSMIDEEACEECPLYGITGTDHCEKDCIRLAINALEQEPCTDVISRQAAMDCFKKWQPYMATRLWDFEKELSALPPVTPAEKVGKPNRWIPVSERLPEQGQKVLVTTKRDNVAKITWNQWFQTQTQYPKTEIIAWMPLPEPYKASPTGGREEKRNEQINIGYRHS